MPAPAQGLIANDGRMVALGPCLTCQGLFVFDPDLVCSFPYPPPDGPRQPICKPCITDRINPKRAAAGHALFPILPGAYLEEEPRA